MTQHNSTEDPFQQQLDASTSLPPNANSYLDVALNNESLKQRAVAGAGATLVSQAFKFVLKFGSVVVLGRLLLPADFGLVAMVAPILGFVSTINDLGFAQAIVQKRDITHRQVSSLFWINTLVSMGLATVVMLAAPLVGMIYGEPRTVGVTVVLATLIFVGTLGLVPNALLSRRMSFVPQAVIEIVTLAINIGVSIVAALHGLGYWSLVLGQVAGSVSGCLFVWTVVRWIPDRPVLNGGVGPLVKFGMNLTGVNLASYFSMTADNMIVGVYGGKVQLGLYDRSYNLVVQPLSQLMSPVARIAVPLLSRLDDPQRYRSTYLNMLKLTCVLTAPAMICFSLLPAQVVRLLLGPRWTEAAPIFAWICFGGILAPIFSTTGWLFTTQGRTAEQMKLAIVTALISIASFAVGIRYGAVGVAAASALTFNFLQTPLVLWRVTRSGQVSTSDMGRALVSLAVAAVAATVAVEAIEWADPPGLLFIAFSCAYASFCVGIWAMPGGKSFVQSVVNLRTSIRGARA